MSTLNKFLLCGAALCALAIPPAVAGQKHPEFHFTAMHGGRVLYKSKFHNRHRCDDSSCTAYVYTSVAASSLRKWVRLSSTFYKLNNSGTAQAMATNIRALSGARNASCRNRPRRSCSS